MEKRVISFSPPDISELDHDWSAHKNAGMPVGCLH